VRFWISTVCTREVLHMTFFDVITSTDKALIQYSQITALPKAEPFNVNTMRKWIECNSKPFSINGEGSQSWGKINTLSEEPQEELLLGPLVLQFLGLFWGILWPRKEEKDELDLVVPRCDEKLDSFTRWVGTKWVPFLIRFRNWRKNGKILPSASDLEKAESVARQQRHDIPQNSTCSCEPPPTLNTFSERRMLQFTSAVAMIIACALPVVAITVLSRLHGDGELLGTIAIFTLAFTSGLMLLGCGAHRIDVFTATAA